MGFLGWKWLKNFLVEIYSWVYILQYCSVLVHVMSCYHQTTTSHYSAASRIWKWEAPVTSPFFSVRGQLCQKQGHFYWIHYKCSDFQGACVARFHHESRKGCKSAHRPSLDATLHYQNHCWQRSMMTRCYIELRLALHHVYHSLWTTAWLYMTSGSKICEADHVG